MKKRSRWMRGLLECEQFIQTSDLDTAKFYFDVELREDDHDFQAGWLDAIRHYRRLGRDGYVHPDQR